MRSVAYELVDVFTERPFGGNQLAVFLDADGLDTTTMQMLANELNLSESVFVHSAQDDTHDVHLRIFTPRVELPLAGHPTVGAAYVLARAGRAYGRQTLRCLEGVGVVNVALVEGQGGALAAYMEQPMPEFGHTVNDRATAAAMLSLDEADLMPDMPVQVVSAGVPFLYVPVQSMDGLARASVRMDVWEKYVKDDVPASFFVFTTQAQHPDSTVRARMFAPSMGIAEDPATGAASGPLGAYLTRYDLTDDPRNIISEQGYEMGRPSRVYISVEQEAGQVTRVTVGGLTQPVGSGHLLLPD